MYGFFQTTFYFGYMAVFSMSLGLVCGTIGYMGTRFAFFIKKYLSDFFFLAFLWGKYTEPWRLIEKYYHLRIIFCSCNAPIHKGLSNFKRLKPKIFPIVFLYFWQTLVFLNLSVKTWSISILFDLDFCDHVIKNFKAC